MKKLKHILTISAIAVMAVIFAPLLQGSDGQASAVTEGWTKIGTCEYQLTGPERDKTLTIRPEDGGTSGTLPDGYSYDSWPWYDEHATTALTITDVDIKPGVKAGNSTEGMFSTMWYCENINGLSNLDTSNVKNMEEMFFFCLNLKTLDLSNFDTSNVENMKKMFYSCTSLETLDLSKFNTSKVEKMQGIVGRCDNMDAQKRIEYIKTLLNTNNALCTDWASLLFYECKDTSINLSGLPDTAAVTDMSWMFRGCMNLESLNLSNLNTWNVTDMSYMFEDCQKLQTLDLSGFDTWEVTNMNYMFDYCSSLTTILVNERTWNTSRVQQDHITMFYNCKKLVGGAGTTYEVNYSDKIYAHIDGGESNPGYLTEKPSITEETRTCFLAQGKSYKKSVKYSWNKVSGAAKYKVYQAKCGKKYKNVKTTTSTTYTEKKLRRGTKYKAYVVAYNSAGKAIAKTPAIHNITTKGSRSNAVAVTAAASAEIKAGTSTNVKAEITKKDSKKKLLWKHHVSAPIRYYSADTSVATVDKNGNVTGIKAGTANIYAVAPNGVSAVTKVTVTDFQD